MNKDKVQNQNILGTLVNKDESGIIAYSDQIYDKKADKSIEEENTKQNERLDNAEAKDKELQSTLEGITKTGEASAASNVSYNHNDSQLDASNVQQAIDEVYSKGNTNRENTEAELEKSISDNRTAVDASIQDVYKKSNYNDGEDRLDFASINFIHSNPEYLATWTDNKDRLFFGIKKDGNFVFGKGVPTQIKGFINAIATSLEKEIKTKADIEEVSKKNIEIESSIADSFKKSNPNDAEGNVINTNSFISVEDNPEYVKVLTDSLNKIIEALSNDGVRHFFQGIDIQGVKLHTETNDSDFILAWVDSKDRVLFGVTRDLEPYWGKGVSSQYKEYVNKAVNAVNENMSNVSDSIKTLSKEVETLKPTEQGTIEDLYPSKEVIPILGTLDFVPSDDSTTKQNFIFLWFSDQHSVSRRLKRIISFRNLYSKYIDDTISTGDANHSFSNDFSFWMDSGASDVLNIMGNHETFGGTRDFNLTDEDKANNISRKYINSYNVPGYSSKECFDKFIAPYLNDTKIVSVKDKCYFYKDYQSFNIRIIGIDIYHWKETINCTQEYSDGTASKGYKSEVHIDGTSVDRGEQLTWFKSVLEDARQKGLNVICLSHAPNINRTIDCTFSDLGHSQWAGTPIEALQAVDEFMAEHTDDYGAGKFIAWFMGHTHCDLVGYNTAYPKQLQLVMDTSGSLRQAKGSPWEFTGHYDRTENTRGDDLFNIVGIDTANKHISIIRFGSNFDHYGRHVGSLLLDYNNLKVINNY